MAQSEAQNLFDQHGHINYDKVVEHVHKKLVTFLASSLDESFHRSNDPKFRKQFSEVSIKTRNEAFKSFISKREKISSDFYAEFVENFHASSNTHSKNSSCQMHAVETDLIELTLAVDNLIKKVEENNRLPLKVLKLRMQELSYYALVEFNINSLSPTEFFPLFQNSIFSLNISIEAKIFLCKVISQFVIPNLNEFYAEINDFLMQMEILAAPKDLEYAMASENNAEKNTANDASGLHMSTGQFFAIIEPETGEQENNAQKELIAENNSQQIDMRANNSPSNTPDLDQNTIGTILQPYNANIRNDSSPGQRREFVRALSTVQRIEFSNNAIFKPGQIKTAIRRTLHEKGALDAEVIVRNEEEIIDFVSKIFDVILDDEVLCVEIKNLLSKLQISIIKLALVDFTFFQNPKHPARKLLNKLTSIGMQVSSDKDVLFVRLKSIINLVSENFETDTQLFELALSEINKLDSLNLDEIQAEEEKRAHSLSSNSRRTAAKRTVIHTIKKYLNKRELPNVMLDFCLKCWAPHMGMVYIEYGNTSKQWRKSVRTLRRVIEVSQAAHNFKQVQQYIPDPYEFFDYICVELKYLSSESQEFEEIIESAEYWYTSYLDDITPKVVEELEEIKQPELPIEEKPDENASNISTNNESMIDVFNKITDANTSSVSSTLIQSRDEIEQYITRKAQHEDVQSEKTNDSSETVIDETQDNSKPKLDVQANQESAKHATEIDEKLTLDDLPKNIVPGAWLEIYQGEEKAKRRLKFSSADKNTASLLFTDRSGDYRLEIDVNTFMHDLNSGRSRLMVESNLFDVALSSVISNIRGEQNKFNDLN